MTQILNTVVELANQEVIGLDLTGLVFQFVSNSLENV